MLYIVGFGSGSAESMTAECREVILRSELVAGYTVYTDILKKYFPEKKYFSNGMRQERERVKTALDEAETKTVSLVCSGDPQLYGMAGLALAMNTKNIEIQVVAGVTSAFSGGAVLGSPLTNDFSVISLSDILTPMEKIEKRLRCSADADFVIVLYNPSSKKRCDYLKKACDIIMEYRKGETVCGYVRNIGREGQESKILSLSELRNTPVDMFTTVFIGNSETKEINGKMVTPRGYGVV